VTWGELFFDLVFVFAVTQLSALLHGDHDWAGVGRSLLVFVPVYWAWALAALFVLAAVLSLPQRLRILASHPNRRHLN
jgi:low temperature requirement protein LtrA